MAVHIGLGQSRDYCESSRKLLAMGATAASDPLTTVHVDCDQLMLGRSKGCHGWCEARASFLQQITKTDVSGVL